MEPVVHYIDKTDETSTITIGKIDMPKMTDEVFTDLWYTHPKKYNTVMIGGKIIDTPRWQETYNRNYTYSGVVHDALEIPENMKYWFEKAKELVPDVNQMMVNWYEDGTHYIGPHSDNSDPLIPGSPILSFSFGATRIFRIRKKKYGGSGEILLDVPTKHGKYMILSWNANKNYTHEIVKINSDKKIIGARINMTFRCFK